MSKDEEKNEIHIGDWVVSLKVYPRYPTECFIKFRSGIFKPDLEVAFLEVGSGRPGSCVGSCVPKIGPDKKVSVPGNL